MNFVIYVKPGETYDEADLVNAAYAAEVQNLFHEYSNHVPVDATDRHLKAFRGEFRGRLQKLRAARDACLYAIAQDAAQRDLAAMKTPKAT